MTKRSVIRVAIFRPNNSDIITSATFTCVATMNVDGIELLFLVYQMRVSNSR